MINAVLHIHIDNMTVCLRVPQKPWRISDPLLLEHDQTQYIYIYTHGFMVYGTSQSHTPHIYIYMYYIYMWSRVSCSHPAPIWYGGGVTPLSTTHPPHLTPTTSTRGVNRHIYIYICVCIYVYYLDICIYTYMYITHTYIYTYTHIHTCIILYISIHVHIGTITISGGGGTTKRWAIYIYVICVYIYTNSMSGWSYISPHV